MLKQLVDFENGFLNLLLGFLDLLRMDFESRFCYVVGCKLLGSIAVEITRRKLLQVLRFVYGRLGNQNLRLVHGYFTLENSFGLALSFGS